MNAPLASLPIPLTVPVPVADAEGKAANRNGLVLRRPKTRHVKQLAAILGADLVKLIFDGQDGAGRMDIDAARIAVQMAEKLMTIDRLDALTALIAELCDEKPELIDDLDPVDLFAVLKGLMDFFPSLQSFGSTS